MNYTYRLYRPDGSSMEIGKYARQLGFNSTKQRKGLYELLDTTSIDKIPRGYYPESDAKNGNVIYYGDGDARQSGNSEQNRHMRVLIMRNGEMWDIVGSVVREERHASKAEIIAEVMNGNIHK